MEFLDVLNDFEHEKINLSIEMLNNPNHEIEVKSLQDVMKMSRYKILSLIESLNDDIKFLTGFTGITVDTKMIIPGKHFSRYLLDVLKKYYFDLTPIKALIIEMLEGGNFPTFRKIEIKYGWSKSYFYQQKNKYEQLLNDMKSERNFDEESAIRYFFYSVFDFFGSFPNEVDLSLDTIISDDSVLVNLSNIQKYKAEMMLWIVKKRVLNRKYISQNNIVLDVDLSKCFTFNYLSLTESKKEKLFLLQFYYYIGVFHVKNLNKVSFRKKEQIVFEKISKLIENKLIKILKKKNLYKEKLKKVSYEIAAQVILDKKCYIKVDNFSINVNYFAEIYPSLDNIVKGIVRSLSDIWYIPDNKRTYFNIVTCLLYSEVPFVIHDRIKLCIDFSGGPYVNAYILKLFKNYVNINIEISNRLTKDTDLYLSDQYIEYQTIDQVIWIKPPTPLDWAEFGEKIVEIKQRKYYSIHER